MSITKETRLASYLDRPVTRQEAVLRVIREAKAPLTARQVMVKLGLADMNSVRPRITELMRKGKLVAVDTVIDGVTGRPVCAFEAVAEDGE